MGPLRELHFLHGFLGKASDWNELLPQGWDSRCYELFSPLGARVPSGLSGAGEWLNRQAQGDPALTFSHPDLQLRGDLRVLVGYSLGGRIALHALTQAPDLWSAAVFISTHPGLASENERQVRLKTDESWASRFENEDWDSLMSHWNAQPVFAGRTQALPRRSDDFSRKALAEGMKSWSLGSQRDFREDLRRLHHPILWISGERDAKFRAIAEEMGALNSRIERETFLGAGHRVPWECPEGFVQVLSKFLSRLR